MTYLTCYKKDSKISVEVTEVERRVGRSNKLLRLLKKTPYEAGKKVLYPKCETKFKCDSSELNNSKSSTLSDHFHIVPLPPLPYLPPAPEVHFDFNSSNLKIDDFAALLNSLWSCPSLGVKGIPYKVYKKEVKYVLKNMKSEN